MLPTDSKMPICTKAIVSHCRVTCNQC